MSDGSLRALAIFVAAFHGRINGARKVRLIGIEEPEVAIHPGGAQVSGEALSNRKTLARRVEPSHSLERHRVKMTS